MLKLGNVIYNCYNLCMRSRTPTIKVPLFEIEANRQLALREAAAHKSRISFMLQNITRKVVDYPACPQSEITIDDFMQLPAHLRRSYARISPIRVANMYDGVGIIYKTEDFLEDQKHRLVLPKIGDVDYSRWAINIDCQKVPSQDINVSGLEQIAANSDIYPALNFCMGALAVEASSGWANAFK